MKRIIAVSIALLILAACAPTPTQTPLPVLTATVVPSPLPSATLTSTPLPTATSIASVVPTTTPTSIPTRIPMLANVPVTDPKYSNPELFDLANPDAPIPQFVYAMKMGGIQISPVSVRDSLTYKVLKNVNGESFVVAVYNLDPDPNKKGETYEWAVPLFIVSDMKTGNWAKVSPALLANKLNIEIGTSIYPKERFNSSYYDRVSQFNAIELVQPSHYIDYASSFPFKINETLQKEPKKMADQFSQNLMVGNLFWVIQYPAEAKTNPENAMRQMLKTIFSNKQVGDKRDYDWIGGKKPLRVILNHELLGVTPTGNAWWDPMTRTTLCSRRIRFPSRLSLRWRKHKLQV